MMKVLDDADTCLLEAVYVFINADMLAKSPCSAVVVLRLNVMGTAALLEIGARTRNFLIE
jgi:hypothetical protein